MPDQHDPPVHRCACDDSKVCDSTHSSSSSKSSTSERELCTPASVILESPALPSSVHPEASAAIDVESLLKDQLG